MKTTRAILALVAASLLPAVAVSALSTPIGRDINFPGNYDPSKAAAIRKVIQDDRFKFVEGTVSHWPPDWGTRLSYSGDARSLNEFFESLRRLKGISLRAILYHGRDDALRRDSAWQLDFSHARPNQLTVYVNRNAKELDFKKVKLPKRTKGSKRLCSASRVTPNPASPGGDQSG